MSCTLEGSGACGCCWNREPTMAQWLLILFPLQPRGREAGDRHWSLCPQWPRLMDKVLSSGLVAVAKPEGSSLLAPDFSWYLGSGS